RRDPDRGGDEMEPGPAGDDADRAGRRRGRRVTPVRERLTVDAYTDVGPSEHGAQRVGRVAGPDGGRSLPRDRDFPATRAPEPVPQVVLAVAVDLEAVEPVVDLAKDDAVAKVVRAVDLPEVGFDHDVVIGGRPARPRDVGAAGLCGDEVET